MKACFRGYLQAGVLQRIEIAGRRVYTYTVWHRNVVLLIVLEAHSCIVSGNDGVQGK